ncbi:MAG: glutaredoxin 3 [Gammaproteobacteria bacterium]|nr:glutaredoxin 3 [Gammaproteobacteria bacterium]
MAKVEVYSSAACSYCVRAKMLLDQKKISYQEIRVDQDESKRDEMIERSGRRTVPQIFIDDKHIGGFDDMWALEQKGELDRLLNN